MTDNKPLTTLTAGKVLHQRRLELGISVEQASIDTKVQKRYLVKIEGDDFDKFDSPVFISGFIKIYADYLGLDVDKVLALYRRSDKEITEQKKKIIYSKQPESSRFDIRDYLTQRNILLAALSLIIISVFAYLSYQYYIFQSPPGLTITTPTNNTETDEPEITVEGSTEGDVIIEINEERIDVGDDLKFTSTVALNPGQNSISIRAFKQDNTESETIEILTVTYNDPTQSQDAPQEEPIEPDPEPTPPVQNSITLRIQGAPAWIVLDIDGTQVLAQVVEAGYTEVFEINESFTLNSGRPSNTSMLFNDQVIELPLDTETGLINTTCEIDEGEMICQ